MTDMVKAVRPLPPRGGESSKGKGNTNHDSKIAPTQLGTTLLHIGLFQQKVQAEQKRSPRPMPSSNQTGLEQTDH